MRSSIDRILLLVGIVIPIWFIGVIVVLGALFPGYSHIMNQISELGALNSPVAGLMNPFGFVVTGLLVVLFSIGLYRAVQFGWPGKMAIFCLIVTGLLLSALGFFRCDPACLNVSPIAKMHDLTSQILFGFMIAAFFLFTFDARPDESFRTFSRWSFVVAIIMAVLAYFDMFIQTPFPGLVQRMLVAIPLVIMAFFGWHLSRS